MDIKISKFEISDNIGWDCANYRLTNYRGTKDLKFCVSNMRGSRNLILRKFSVSAWQLCQYCTASLTVLLKRRAVPLAVLASSCLLVLLLTRWGFICINMQSWWHFRKICAEYKNGASGELCPSFCEDDQVSALTCQSSYSSKQTIFTATYKDTDIFVKSPPLNTVFKSDQNIPIEKFSINVKTKFNIVITEDETKNMTRFFSHYSQDQMSDSEVLLQDNEFLALLIYERYEIFPNLLGFCGRSYATEKLSSLSALTHLVSLDDSKEEWLHRVRVAIMIMDFLKIIEENVPEPLKICDVKINNFGLTNNGKVKYLDLDSVHPKSIANKITADGSNCVRHSDCDFLDCRSFCNLITFRCDHKIVNNNLQIVCEKIFLGWAVSGRILVPGLLLGPRSPRALTTMLQSCANPSNELGSPRAIATPEIRKRLYNLLMKLKAM